ncbi:single-stranded DNA-binding protein [Roseibacillus ishigakijimensis]|uniref:Single-stranded DNA-binding protein n=2 Tax=Roseibacillus ishigakijimensis TaxID=454146 RepID=A0A934VME5_9BACT|nr:R3H domain-containing nucleic acid-binding protein [Roseibacillus ishigakijimensis]MBK1834197.1 single-stranded DNA-binding protein [Roseibacillus ishigakijimensis]
MNDAKQAEEILDSILGKLGFSYQIEHEDSEEGAVLQIRTEQGKYLIGRSGDRLDDIQYLVNRILQKKNPDAERVRVDCEDYRVEQEQKLCETVLEAAEKVKATGKPVRLKPLNAYYRRIAHNAVVDDPEIETTSPGGNDRMKRITLRLAGS